MKISEKALTCLISALVTQLSATPPATHRRSSPTERSRRLWVAGGVALNCVTNALIRQASAFSDIFIPSAPHDAGTAIGAATDGVVFPTRMPAAGDRRNPVFGAPKSDERFWLPSRRPVWRRGEARTPPVTPPTRSPTAIS